MIDHQNCPTMEKPMTRHRLGIALLSSIIAAFVVAALAPATWAQTPDVDPQALVGQWSGTWTGKVPSENGRYYLTIERVQDGKVFGKGEFVARKTTEFKVVGTLSGNRLTFGRTDLTVNGNQMTGTGPEVKLDLTKAK
jgi:hypothetical protein